MPLPEGAGSGELNKLFTSFDFPVLPASLDHSFLLRCDLAFLTNGLELQFVVFTCTLMLEGQCWHWYHLMRNNLHNKFILCHPARSGYVHATFSDGILATACSFLLEWATKTATEGSNVMDVLRPMEVMKKYLDFCLGNFKVGKLPEGEENGPRVMMKVHEAAFAVKGLLRRISAAQEGALFIALMEGELAGTEMMKDLPQDLASIAAIQEIDWEKEAASVTSDEADIAVFFAKMPRFETAVSFTGGGSELQKKEIEALSELTKRCESFKEVFIQQLEKAFAAIKESMIERFDSFVLKYQELEEATKEWKMAKFEYLFQEDAENEVQQDIESFKTVRQEFLELAGKVSGAMEQHGVSQSGDLKRIMMECQSFVDLGSGKARSGALYSALLLFSHCIVKRTGGDVQDVESYLKKSFGNEVALDKMPQKMITLVKEVVSESQSEKVVAGSGGKSQKGTRRKRRTRTRRKSLPEMTRIRKEQSELPRRKPKARKRKSRRNESSPARSSVLLRRLLHFRNFWQMMGHCQLRPSCSIWTIGCGQCDFEAIDFEIIGAALSMPHATVGSDAPHQTLEGSGGRCNRRC